MAKKPTGNRKSIRLEGYNYSYPGYYYITINTHRRRRRFGMVHNYYERLIPDDEILRRTRLYILNNPVNWRP
jgi:hypothetical protein